MRAAPSALLTLLAVAAPSAPTAAQCEVQGVGTVTRLRVRVPGQRLRTFTAVDLPVAVRPGRGALYRDARVLAPLAFGARTDAPIPFHVRANGPVEGGVLFLTAGVPLSEVRHRRGTDRAQVAATLAPGVVARRVQVPCGDLVVGPGEGGAAAPSVPAAGPLWTPEDERLWVLREPGAGPAIRLDTAGASVSPTLHEQQRRGPWVQVAAAFEGSGAVLRGWVRAAGLRRAPEARDASPVRARPVPTPAWGRCARSPRPGEYVGPARLSVGTQVRARPGGPTWALISEPAILTVVWTPGSAWARILHVPGLYGDGRCPQVLRRAWVRRRAVILQGEGDDPSLLLALPP